MSEVERLDPTAGGDAPVVETPKTGDVGDAILQSTECAPESINVTSGNVTAPVEKAGAPTEIKHLIETNSGNMLEEVANPNMGVAQSKDADATDAEIANLVAEDTSAVGVNAQMPAAEVDSSIAITLQDEEASEKSVDEEKADESTQNTKSNSATCVSRLEAELRKRTKERDDYRKKLGDMETKLAALQASYDTITNHGSDENTLQQSVEQLHGQLAQTAMMYEERNRVITNQENQINALNNQVASLKEVVSITRDLLQIRNMEVKQLQAEVDNMEKKISEERDRHNAMLNKMDTAMRLNADLKKEYETQLSLFQSLREKYGEKITLLTGGKEALDTEAASTSE
ncbi:tropomyosin [Ooceraea biroi]|nr:tropomyosin [Ooceraea biroi]XP_011352432.2 tropomyosin [Ooceraea biroi]